MDRNEKLLNEKLLKGIANTYTDYICGALPSKDVCGGCYFFTDGKCEEAEEIAILIRKLLFNLKMGWAEPEKEWPENPITEQDAELDPSGHTWNRWVGFEEGKGACHKAGWRYFVKVKE